MNKYPFIRRISVFSSVLFAIIYLLPVMLSLLLISGDALIASLTRFFPLLGAILGAIALRQGKQEVRGIIFLVIGFGFSLTRWLFENDLWSDRGVHGNAFLGSLHNLGWLLSFLLSFGIAGIIAGTSAFRVNYEDKFARLFVLIGGIMLCLFMVVPQVQAQGYWFVMLILPIFGILGPSPFIGISFLLYFLLLIVAAVLSIRWGLNSKKGRVDYKKIQVLLGTAFLLFFLCSTIDFLIYELENESTGILSQLIRMITYASFTLGIFLAKCAGLAEFVAYADAKRHAEKNKALQKESSDAM